MCITKVKGHATKDDVAKGLATPKDKDGNDEADDCATKGVESIGIKDATNWLDKRHNRNKALMDRIHVMIIKVIQKETEVQTGKIEARNFIAGYDETKFVKTDGRIKGPEMFQGPAKRLQLKPPVQGNHKLAKVQELYEDVSHFLADQSWRTPTDDTRASGTTWLELFILFDTTGARSEGGSHIRDAEAKERAEKRRSNNKNENVKIKREGEHTAAVKPTLDNEIRTFTKP